ncbi:MAG TPA: sulfite exporter TauE/SafE family protein, partial [Maritimibacter sp.]|nr:sulfite exporter TauE/SafE family protein [Maritimibacter sp.]
MLEIVVLAVAGFAAGMLNAVTGGGTFISFPALIHGG